MINYHYSIQVKKKDKDQKSLNLKEMIQILNTSNKFYLPLKEDLKRKLNIELRMKKIQGSSLKLNYKEYLKN